MKRLDTIPAGSTVLLKMDGQLEVAFFLGVDGVGESRKAAFVQADGPAGNCFEWEAYRFKGGWAYGSSAGSLSLVGVLSDPQITTYSDGSKQVTFNL